MLIFLYNFHRDHILLKLKINKLSPTFNVKNKKKLEFSVMNFRTLTTLTFNIQTSSYDHLSKICKHEIVIIFLPINLNIYFGCSKDRLRQFF